MMRTAAARLGDAEAASWDGFLSRCPRGQFQQTDGWAKVKALDGWSPCREYLDPGVPGSGGFQLLWKKSRFGRIGYVSKGPVLPEESDGTVKAALEALTGAARRLHLLAVVLQPPDDSRIGSEILVARGFCSQPLTSIIRSTGVISLEGGADAIMKRVSPTTRKRWRRARRLGVRFALGTRRDLPEFFELMCDSCRRHGQTPNPGRPELLEALWDALPGKVCLAFAEQAGRRLAGRLMIREGDRVISWKKGWHVEQPANLNQFLAVECLMWATGAGCLSLDVVSMSPAIAERILANEELSAEQSCSGDAFSLELGARPKFLPPAHLFITNPLLRSAVYTAFRCARLRAMLERRIG